MKNSKPVQRASFLQQMSLFSFVLMMAISSSAATKLSSPKDATVQANARMVKYAGKTYSATAYWEPSPSTNIASYTLYYATGTTSKSVTTSNLTAHVSGLKPRTTYTFYVIANDALNAHSGPSNSVSYTTPR